MVNCWLWLSNRFAETPEFFPDRERVLAFSEELIDAMSDGLQKMCVALLTDSAVLQFNFACADCLSLAPIHSYQGICLW